MWMELHPLQAPVVVAVVVSGRGLIGGLSLTIDLDLHPPVRGKWISQPSPELPDGELGAGNITILGHSPDPIHCPNEEFHNNVPGV